MLGGGNALQKPPSRPSIAGGAEETAAKGWGSLFPAGPRLSALSSAAPARCARLRTGPADVRSLPSRRRAVRRVPAGRVQLQVREENLRDLGVRCSDPPKKGRAAWIPPKVPGDPERGRDDRSSFPRSHFRASGLRLTGSGNLRARCGKDAFPLRGSYPVWRFPPGCGQAVSTFALPWCGVLQSLDSARSLGAY